MKKLMVKLVRFGLVHVIGKVRLKNILITLAKIAGIDLMLMAYNSIGILKSENMDISGEHFFIRNVLKDRIKSTTPVFFDVGANVGKYTLALLEVYPDAKIFSFEPNINTFEILKKNINHNAECIGAGLGAAVTTGKIYTYADSLSSSHASMYGDVFEVMHQAEDVVGIDINMTTVDSFCAERGIEEIDLLKIDTEGNELEILKGSSAMLSGNRIKMIQFEFGECNVFSKVYLRDFYNLLPDYRFYRLNTDSLIALFKYKSTNEIFRFQNIIAIHNSLEEKS